jgi:hypothetical protein
MENIVSPNEEINIDHHLSNVKSWLKSTFKIPMRENKKTYFTSQERMQRLIRSRIKTYVDWCHTEFFSSFFRKYNLKLGKMKLYDVTRVNMNIIDIDYHQSIERGSSEWMSFEGKVGLYKVKETTNLSNTGEYSSGLICILL